MTKLRNFLRDETGVAAVEMALIAPFLVGFAVMSMNVWDVGMRKQDLRGALKIGAQYYLNGGTNDVTAKAVILAAWNRKPAVAEITITRVNLCGSATSADDVTPCADTGMLPAIYAKIHAEATTSTAVLYKSQSADEYVRVR
jgi:Flp pilus assembly protein TadG